MIETLPIRIRLALLSALAAGVAAASIGALALVRSSDTTRADFDIRLSEEAGEAFQFIARDRPIAAFAETEPRAGLLQRVALFDQGGAVVDSTEPEPPWEPHTGPLSQFVSVADTEGGPPWRMVALPVDNTVGAKILVVAQSTAILENELRSLRFSILRLIALAMVAVGAASYVLTSGALRPIEALRRSAESLALSPDGRRLDVPETRDEVRRLAETLNDALEQIDATTRVKRRFVAEASHELRTPLARLRAELDLARRPTRTAAEIRTALDQIELHAVHLTSLSDSLLSLLSTQERQPDPEPCRIREVLNTLRSVSDRPFTIELPSDPRPILVRCDVHGLVGALSNLVENAYIHGAPPVVVSALPNDSEVVITVRDHGPGISEQLGVMAFEPFVRGPDAAEGGAGLGLAIVAQTILHSGGTIAIDDADPGCLVTIRLPLIEDTEASSSG
jgi:signal transduction histidine kinase